MDLYLKILRLYSKIKENLYIVSFTDTTSLNILDKQKYKYENKSLITKTALLPKNINIYLYIELLSKTNEIQSVKKIEKKYKEYKKIQDNLFLDNDTKKEIQKIFEMTQRTYYILTRFVLNIKKSKIKNNYKITTDLSLTPLEINHKHTFIITESNAKYMFSIIDLLKIIENAILYAPDFFEQPLEPRNPYTNIKLEKSILYILFYKLYKINYNIPEILIQYFKCNFDLDLFKMNHQQEIRELVIKKYVTNAASNILYEEIIEMIDFEFYITNTHNDKWIKIDDNFPKQDLIEIMRPYLYLYLLANHSINGSEKKRMASILFRMASTLFMKYNINFGKKITKEIKQQESIKIFNDNYPKLLSIKEIDKILLNPNILNERFKKLKELKPKKKYIFSNILQNPIPQQSNINEGMFIFGQQNPNPDTTPNAKLNELEEDEDINDEIEINREENYEEGEEWEG